MARQCHLNTCPVGIATQDETLRMRFNGKPEMIIAYFRSLAEEVRQRMARMGVRSLGELCGWYDRLDTRSGMDAFMVVPISEGTRVAPQQVPVEHTGAEDDSLYFNKTLGERAESQAIHNSDRSVGAGLSGELMRRRSHDMPSDGEITQAFDGSAGQSFGAFLAEGVTLKLTGEANDYVGKGLSGGTISVGAGSAASRRGDVLAGNTVLYGATSGQLYIAGRAGERFAVRNSGALAVVEGVGQHGCEYMTGGVVLVLGPLGLNFGSGMTGGLAYVLRAEAEDVLNRDFVTIHDVEAEEEASLRRVLEEHLQFTGSPRASRLLSRRNGLPFVRVQPVHLQASVTDTWKPILAGFRLREATLVAPGPRVSQAALHV
jgi:glutamate synthase domain-containing protein 3